MYSGRHLSQQVATGVGFPGGIRAWLPPGPIWENGYFWGSSILTTDSNHRIMKYRIILVTSLLFVTLKSTQAQELITTQNRPGAFPIDNGIQASSIWVDPQDFFVVRKAATLFSGDIRRVTGHRPVVRHRLPSSAGNLIIIGTLDSSSAIGELIRRGKIHPDGLRGKWEAYQIQVVSQPFPGIGKALVIVGSDRRGTAYGVFTLSRQMGVSPWYWWADVPVKKKKRVYVKAGTYYYGPPAVKYRGIFINDEAPALSGWVQEKFGGFNHQFYEKVFELLLRLRANYLWPAMWGSAFNNDDTLNPVMASKYAIVMGTSHQEPMNQATEHWRRQHAGAWNYQTNDSVLRDFWRKGIQNMDHRETVVTIGMRGDGDKPMSEKSNIALLERIVHDQRKIIAQVTGKPAAKTPQDWALYKEVQNYYDQGMRVPDDVTLLFSDDNWGNIRRLPALKDSARPGGFGIYYHFDYVGGPRNYKWINTNQISRVYEQMHLAYQYHARRIWIVNVGDIKPMEFPISFFMDYAFDADHWTPDRFRHYALQWATAQFGHRYAPEIAGILKKYTRYNSRRKPELLSPHTYSLAHYREAVRVVAQYDSICGEAKSIYAGLPAAYKPAFYQLVLFPVAASDNLNKLYVTIARNRLYATEGRASTNLMADSARTLFMKDSLLSHYYNKVLENGRWDHFMDQTHIGYTYWQQPPYNQMPAVRTITLPDKTQMGISVSGTQDWWPQSSHPASLPRFNSWQKNPYDITIFSRGSRPVSYTLRADKPWIQLSAHTGKTSTQAKIAVTIDWSKAPGDSARGTITVSGPGISDLRIAVTTFNPVLPAGTSGFIESDRYLSMEASHYTAATNTPSVHWQIIPGLGRTLSGVTTWPTTVPPSVPGPGSPCLQYRFYLFDMGQAQIKTYLSPTLDFLHQGGLRFGLSMDDEPPVVTHLQADSSRAAWSRSVSNNITISGATFHVHHPGWHTLKFWRIDPGVVLQKITINLGGVKASYLGPPESHLIKRKP